jgi:outer membrane cobalamin receptor
MRKLIMSLLLLTAINQSLYAKESDLALEDELKWLRAENVVEVVSKQKENINLAAGIVSVMSSQDIERYNAKNLSELLNRVTSIYTLGSGVFPENAVSVRGDLYTHHSNHVLALINGRPFRDGLTGGLSATLYRDFPIHQIDHIEVVRGPGSVLYGTNAYSGVINIVTKKNKENVLTVRSSYGSFDSKRLETEVAWKNSEIALTGAIRYSNSDGWLFSARGEDNQPYHFRANDNAISGSFEGEWHGITLNGFIANHDINHWGPIFIGNGQVINDNRVFLDFGYKTQFNSHWLTQWNLTFNKESSQFNSNTPNSNGNVLLNSGHSLLLEQTHFFNFLDNKLNFLLGGLVEWKNGDGNVKFNYLKSSLYAELNYYILKKLKLNIGGQWNRTDQLSSMIGSSLPAVTGQVGRLGLTYEITQNSGIKLLYSQAFRDPTASELEVNIPGILFGNSYLQPEKVNTIDAQIFYHAKTYSLSLTAFRSSQSNLIERYSLPNTTATQYVNANSRVTFQGLEFESEFKPFKALQLTGNYTFQTNSSKGQNNRTPTPNHIVKLGLSYDITPELQLSAFDTFFSAPKSLPNKPIINPIPNSYHNLTLNTTYRLDTLFGFTHSKQITFSLYLDNLLNEQIYYPDIANRGVNSIPAMPGRTLFGELTIEF